MRYAFTVLAVLMLLLSAANLLFTVSVEHKFCQVTGAATATSVQKPADPAANPSREQSWQWYERFYALGKSLGC
jgi:hypothetical protein